MLKRKVPFSLLVFLLLFSGAAQICYGQNSIKIGVIGPIKYSQGKELWNGAVLAAEEINTGGGVKFDGNRIPIELIQADSNEYLGSNTAAGAAELLIFKYNVDFIIGGFRSEAVLAIQDVAMDHKKIYCSAGAASMELSQRVAQFYDRYKYYFRLGTFNNYDMGKACFLQLNYIAENLRSELGIRKIRVAIAAEKARWVESVITAARFYFPRMGLELAGVFQSSPVATDVSDTIKAVARTKAPIVLTLFSGNVGIPFVSQASDMKLPAVLVGINAEAQKNDFWEATHGKADYAITLTTFAPNVEISDLTKPFLDNYTSRFGDLPSYTANGTYTAIANILVPAIETNDTLDADTLVEAIEKNTFKSPNGVYAFVKDELGRPLHELKFGVGYSLPLAVQWQKGKMEGIWPNNYQEKPGTPTLTYKGIVDFQIPQWVIEKHKIF